eukprot:UN2682
MQEPTKVLACLEVAPWWHGLPAAHPHFVQGGDLVPREGKEGLAVHSPLQGLPIKGLDPHGLIVLARIEAGARRASGDAPAVGNVKVRDLHVLHGDKLQRVLQLCGRVAFLDRPRETDADAEALRGAVVELRSELAGRGQRGSGVGPFKFE